MDACCAYLLQLSPNRGKKERLNGKAVVERMRCSARTKLPASNSFRGVVVVAAPRLLFRMPSTSGFEKVYSRVLDEMLGSDNGMTI